MYDFFIAVQVIGMIILVVQLIYILHQPVSKIQLCLAFLTTTLLINFVGYTYELLSDRMETSLLAVKFIYLGKPFIVLSMFLLVCQYCRVKLNRYLLFFIILIHISVTVLVQSCEHNTIYYSSISFTEEGLFPHLVFGHGPMYIFANFILLAVYYISIIVICIRTYKKVDTNIEKKQIKLFILLMTICILSFVVFISGVCRGYDATLIGYLAASVLLATSIIKYRIFDVTMLAKEQVMDSLSEGIVVFNNGLDVVYMNRAAGSICEGLYDNAQSDSKLFDLLREKTDSGADGVIFYNDRVFSINRTQIARKSVYYGNTFLLRDVTENYYYMSRLQKDVEEKTEHIRQIQRRVTLGMADMVENRDNNTGGHVKRTSEVVKIFAERLKKSSPDIKYDDEFYENVIMAAPMHDLGKIVVPDSILNKPGRYTPEEYAQMKVHAAKGAEIVQQVLNGIEDEKFLKIATNIAHYHHEKYDGSGYPEGLKGEDIPYEARIMALADVFDALVSKRCYKEKMSMDKAFGIIEESLDTHFDRRLGVRFLECRKELEAYYSTIED